MLVVADSAPFLEQLRSSPLHYGDALLAKVFFLAGESKLGTNIAFKYTKTRLN